MKLGTKSVLFGYHAFWLHPFFAAAGWWKLYGFPFDPRLWFAFFLHDIGYINKPNMDGVEGQQHPFIGAKIMHFLFDWPDWACIDKDEWYKFTLYHSRSLAKVYFGALSPLCNADKLAFLLYPKSLLKILYYLSGEGTEYLSHRYMESSNSEDKSPYESFNAWYHDAWMSNVKTLKAAGFYYDGRKIEA